MQTEFILGGEEVANQREDSYSFLALIAAITVGFVSYQFFLSQMPYSLENMDYIEINDTHLLIQLKSVKEIGPAFWKGFYDGILFYKNGECVEVQISVYGNFFGIKGAHSLA